MAPWEVLINYTQTKVKFHDFRLSSSNLAAQYHDYISWYGDWNYNDKKVVRWTYLYDRNLLTGNVTYLYWDDPLFLSLSNLSIINLMTLLMK